MIKSNIIFYSRFHVSLNHSDVFIGSDKLIIETLLSQFATISLFIRVESCLFTDYIVKYQYLDVQRSPYLYYFSYHSSLSLILKDKAAPYRGIRKVRSSRYIRLSVREVRIPKLPRTACRSAPVYVYVSTYRQTTLSAGTQTHIMTAGSWLGQQPT